MIKKQNISIYFIILLIIVLNLHTLRNLTDFYFLIYGFLFLFSLFMFIVFYDKLEAEKKLFSLFYIFIMIYCVIISLIFSFEYGNVLIGIARFFTLFPLLLILFLIDDGYIFKKFFLIFLIFGFFSAFTIFYQWEYGAIDFFATPSERIGYVRYASLSGSLTAFGSVVGVFVFLLFSLLKSDLFKIVGLITFLIAAFLSLQKAALSSIFLSLITIFYYNFLDKKLVLRIILLILLLIPIIYVFLENANLFDIITLMLENFTGIADEARKSDVSILESVYDRITLYPFESINYFGYFSLVSGVGVFGASGGLGYDNLPMMHNLIGEIFITFGIIIGIFLILFFLNFFIMAIKMRKSNTLSRVSAGVYINIFLPSLFTGAIFYQPIIGGLFYLSLFYLYFFRKRSY